MRLEQIPILLGVLVALVGLGLVLDAQLPDGFRPTRERRRRERAERNRVGETCVGLGVLCVAAALIGRDTWRFGTVSVLVGVVLLGIGGWLNRVYLRELLLFRGPARRGEKRRDPARRRQPETATRSAANAERPGQSRATADRASADEPFGERSSRSAPLAEDNPRSSASSLATRGDRETPIMTAREGGTRQGAESGEDGGDETPRLRIR